MKLLMAFATVLCLSAASAMAGDGRLTDQSLAKIGLGGMQVMSDSQGLEIRGLGVAEEMGNYGDYNQHPKHEGDKHEGDKHEGDKHDKHHHEKAGCANGQCSKEHRGHQCHQACHPTCHLESLCHVACGGKK